MTSAVKEIINLFEEVLKIEGSKKCCVGVDDALTTVRNVYQAVSHNVEVVAVDYNQDKFRYAYIYYYAVCHTLMVMRQAARIFVIRTSLFRDFMGYEKERLEICSLGGGPGCDLIGLLCLRAVGGLGETKQISCTVVDICGGWQRSLNHLLRLYLKSSQGSLYRKKLKFEVVRSNLLSIPPRQCALTRVVTADILTLVKFVSAIPGANRPIVLELIFGLMKRGAYIFFADNGRGDSYQIISSAAIKAGFFEVSPLDVLAEKIPHKILPTIGPLKMSLKPLSYTFAGSCLWKKP